MHTHALEHLARRLWRLGWLAFPTEAIAADRATPAEIRDAIHAYRTWHGGVHLKDVVAHLDLPRCAHPDIPVASDPNAQRWPQRGLTWALQGDVPGIEHSAAIAAMEWAWGQWAAVCGIEPVRTDDAANANVLVVVAALGPGQLGWTEFPDFNNPVQKRLTLSNSARWVISDAPKHGEADLKRVVAHEAGHGAGIGHLSPPALMAPIYSYAVEKPAAADIAEAVKRYGPPAR